MKVKDIHGDWKRVNTVLTITTEGQNHKEISEIVKMLEDFVSTTLSTQYRLDKTIVEKRVQEIPYPQTRMSITFSRNH